MAKTTFVDVFLRIRNSNIFNASVVSVIIASALYAGVTSYNIPDDYQFILNVFDYGITIFFVIEIIIRLISEKSLLHFFKSGWNIFDFVIVMVSLVPVAGAETDFVARNQEFQDFVSEISKINFTCKGNLDEINAANYTSTNDTIRNISS